MTILLATIRVSLRNGCIRSLRRDEGVRVVGASIARPLVPFRTAARTANGRPYMGCVLGVRYAGRRGRRPLHGVRGRCRECIHAFRHLGFLAERIYPFPTVVILRSLRRRIFALSIMRRFFASLRMTGNSVDVSFFGVIARHRRCRGNLVLCRASGCCRHFFDFNVRGGSSLSG